MDRPRHRGIAGLSRREPIGAALTVGRKGPRGNPIEKDRFHIVLPTEGADRRRAAHPRYRAFNGAPAERRRSLVGQVIHADPDRAFEHYLSAYRGEKGDPTHPAGAPFCRGDGVRATRYTGNPKDVGGFANIPCPNETCRLRVSEPALCRPFARLLFRLVFRPDSGLPSTTVKLATKSWYSVANLAGFWASLEDAATAVGAPFNPAGFRFLLQLEEKSSKARKSRFPVISAVPLDDAFEFFAARVGVSAVQLSGDDDSAAPDAVFGTLETSDPVEPEPET